MVIITIPTLKNDVSEQINDIVKTTKAIDRLDIYATCKNQSAAKNRNECLDYACKNAYASYIIMLDDDITGYYEGWVSDMLTPLILMQDVVMVSARLMTKQGTLADMMGDWDKSRMRGDVVTAADYKGRNVVCSAAIAMRVHDMIDIRYDVGYVGSGYEDTDHCMRVKKTFPEHRIVIANKCKLVHIHEGKGQGATTQKVNRELFEAKWG